MLIALRRFAALGPLSLSLSLLWLGCSDGTENAAARDPARAPSGLADGGSNDDARDGGLDETRDAGTTETGDSGAKASVDGGNTLAADCKTRVGGSWITFSIGNEMLTVWSTNSKFNTEAFLAAAKGTLVTPVFNDLIEGTDCDGQWTWHVDPENVELASSSPECEGLPSAIEADKQHWLGQIDRYCPRDVLISAVSGM